LPGGELAGLFGSTKRQRRNLAHRSHGEWPTAILDLPLVLTEPQLAHVSGVTVRTLQRRRRRGGSIPFKRVGRKVFYSRDDVLSYFGAGNR
jgi:hypothetical protein